MGYVPILLSAAAICASLWMWWRTHRLNQRTLALEEARDADKKLRRRRADLRAKVEVRKIGAFQRQHLVITNDGDGDACEVSVHFNDRPFLEHPAAVKYREGIREIPHRSEVPYMIQEDWRSHAPIRVRITWQDDSGIPGKFEHTLI